MDSALARPVRRTREPGGAYAARRERIVTAAFALFLERGFDDVSVTEVAEAAGVTPKTVFNHFPRKEDLVFTRGDDYLLELLRDLESHDPSEPLTEPFLREVTRQITDTTVEAESLRRMARLTEASPALQRRLTEDFDRVAQRVAELLVRDRPRLARGGLAAGIASALVGMQRQILIELGRSIAAGVPVAQAQRDAHAASRKGFALLRDGFADAEL